MKAIIDRAISSTESISGAESDSISDDQIVTSLAALSPFEYDRVREQRASDMGVRVATLDAQVSLARRKLSLDEETDELNDGIEPWPDAVEGSTLAAEMLTLFDRHTILPSGGALALTLWCMGTYCFNAFRIFPKLCLHSPEKRCGKTTTLEIMTALACRALPTSNVSAAVIYRAIECWQPTLLIDEGDTFIAGNDVLRGVINSGHTRSTAFVLRVEESGGNREPKRFSTWAPMAIATIKMPPDTIRDRSILVAMRRKLPDESTVRIPFDLLGDCAELRQKLKRWADDNIDRMRMSEPEIPVLNSDRAMDNWRPLLAIVDALGGDWAARTRDAMLLLESTPQDEASWGQGLLHDIQQIFTDRTEATLFSDELVSSLIGLEESPWGEWRQGQPITKNQLARLLKPFGIHSRPIRRGDMVKRGYRRRDFRDSFRRYLPVENTPSRTVSPVTALQTSADKTLPENRNVTQNDSLTLTEIPIFNADVACSGVTSGKSTPDEQP